MTAILNFASRRGVVHASDRLLTDPRDNTPFDHASNKAIIFQATDGVAAVGYSGAAFSNTLTMDEWLAEQLLGCSLRDRNGYLPALQMGRNSGPPRTLGHATEALRGSLTSAAKAASFGRDAAAFPMVTVAGFQRGRIGADPVITVLRWIAESNAYMRQGPPRGWHLIQPSASALVGVGVACDHPDVMEALAIKLRGADAFAPCRAAMVTAIRDLAERDPRVGRDAIAIEVSPAPLGTAAVFFEADERTPDVSVQVGERDVMIEPWYSPWIVGPRVIAAPAVHAGPGWIVSSGELKVTLTPTGPPVLKDGTAMLIAPQQRRPRPTR